MAKPLAGEVALSIDANDPFAWANFKMGTVPANRASEVIGAGYWLYSVDSAMLSMDFGKDIRTDVRVPVSVLIQEIGVRF